MKTYLAGEIARALAIFSVDEIIIFNESGESAQPKRTRVSDRERSSEHEVSEPNVFLARILQYVETPQYLRKLLFPFHRDLKFAGLLNPLDCPHHLRLTDDFAYREGVTIESNEEGTLVDAGIRPLCLVEKTVQPNTRVTLAVGKQKGHYIQAGVVSSKTPREKLGVYWGYNVRMADKFSKVLTDCPYKTGYDYVIGTSERGTPLSNAISKVPQYKHLLILFGGLSGLEVAMDADEDLQVGGDRAAEFFDAWVDIVDGKQGSRTIRTEEALLITLSALRNVLLNGHG